MKNDNFILYFILLIIVTFLIIPYIRVNTNYLNTLDLKDEFKNICLNQNKDQEYTNYRVFNFNRSNGKAVISCYYVNSKENILISGRYVSQGQWDIISVEKHINKRILYPLYLD